MAYQSLLVESRGRRILVDTCRGDGRPLPNNRGTVRTDYYANLTAVVPPSDVDLVVCTHLHYDHVGWNVMHNGTAWVPTFPNATYLFGREEYEHWAQADRRHPNVDLTYGVDVVLRAGRHQFVEPGHALTDDVTLVPTPGHSPGHLSVRIRSQGQEGWITGDAVHHPIQLVETQLANRVDLSPDLAVDTRQRLAAHLAETGALIIGTHFAGPAGHLRPDGGLMQFVPVW
jgi:glyoxylase-like metal-dependent hydrolase (beta-lactamase superfamily II)